MNNTHPVRRCAPCDRDWPNNKAYNLCPRCQRCTFASTAGEYPDAKDAAADACRYARVREFDAERDAAAAAERQAWNAEMDALIGILYPDPTPDDSPQRVDYYNDGRGDA